MFARSKSPAWFRRPESFHGGPHIDNSFAGASVNCASIRHLLFFLFIIDVNCDLLSLVMARDYFQGGVFWEHRESSLYTCMASGDSIHDSRDNSFERRALIVSPSVHAESYDSLSISHF